MRLNDARVATKYSTMVVASKIEYGWYAGGRAFIAKDGEVMTFKDAYREFAPKNCYAMHDSFFDGLTQYDKTINGLVRYLIHKYNR